LAIDGPREKQGEGGKRVPLTGDARGTRIVKAVRDYKKKGGSRGGGKTTKRKLTSEDPITSGKRQGTSHGYIKKQ